MISITHRPVLIYDDRCSSCTIFAKYAFKYCRGQINCIGHYSKEGQKFRKMIFPPNYNETEMFWIVTKSHAYGGRSGLLPLLGLIIKSIFRPNKSPNSNFTAYCSDSKLCNDKKFQIKRFYNLLKHGKKLNIRCTKTIND